MSLGYETYEDNRSFEKTGITGNVKRYTVESMSYPCYIISLSDTIARYKLEVLRKMFSVTKNYNEDLANSAISIYFDSGDKLIKFGRIFPTQVKSFLKLFETEDIKGFLNSEKLLQGDYLYVLAN